MMINTLCQIVEGCYFCKIVMAEPSGNLTSPSLYLVSSATIKNTLAMCFRLKSVCALYKRE